MPQLLRLGAENKGSSRPAWRPQVKPATARPISSGESGTVEHLGDDVPDRGLQRVGVRVDRLVDAQPQEAIARLGVQEYDHQRANPILRTHASRIGFPLQINIILLVRA